MGHGDPDEEDQEDRDEAGQEGRPENPELLQGQNRVVTNNLL